ncbi:MAG: SUF system NifU family Fe-S cluster assembly protein [Haloquadratum sp.]|jgi:SUF system FeS assembly protein, NifU family|nr:SUF system NifU family Fe-S cluster assembly protein [Haloferacaceae archaeon]MDR9444640.1 SUF system NifU family Fe-S cluster assembly protein [Haloquadratum sp.]
MGLGADMYRQQILEHYKRPHHYGSLDAPDVVHTGHNPSCGDEITMELRFDTADAVEEVAFSGDGCAISQAAASMLTDRLIGMSREELVELDTEYVTDMLGVEISPMRIKCAVLSRQVAQDAAALDAGVVEVAESSTED